MTDRTFCHFVPFFALSKFWKVEKNTWRYYHFTHVHHKWQLYDIGFLRYGMQQIEFFCHIGLFFALSPPYGPRKSKFWKNEKNTWRYYHFKDVYHKWQSYDVWFLRYGVQKTELFVILSHFLPFYPPKTRKIKILKNKSPGDVIILNMWTINNSHIMYGSWDMEHKRQNFLPFQTIFCPFTP